MAQRPSLYIRVILIAAVLLGVLLTPRTAAGQRSFTLVGLADCGALSGQRCHFAGVAPALALVSDDSGAQQRYTVMLAWVVDTLPDIDQDDQLSVEIQMQADGTLYASMILNVSGASGVHNPGRSTGSVEAREQARDASDDDDDRHVSDAANGEGDIVALESPFDWLGPDRFAGRIRSVLVHPTDRNIIYAGAATGGVWKSTNGGRAWASLDDFMPTQVIGSLTMDPSDPNTIYAGTGEIFTLLTEGLWLRGQDRGQGIFVSRNAGDSWTQLAGTQGPDWLFVSRVAVSPQNSDVILAATATGLFRSTNRGQSFTRLVAGNFMDIKFHPLEPTNAVAGTFGDLAYASTDGGASWGRATFPAALNVAASRIELAPVSQTSRAWRAIHIGRSNGAITLLSSANRGQAFDFTVAGGAPIVCTPNNNVYTGGLWVDPRTTQKLVVGGVDLCKSTDGGATFSIIDVGEGGSDFHAIIAEPGFASGASDGLLIGHDQGLRRVRSYDAVTPTVDNLNNSLRTTQFHSAIADPSSNNVVGGSQDTGTMIREGTSWRRLIPGISDGIMASRGGNQFFFGKSIGRVFRSFTNGTSAACISATGPSPIAESILSGSGECGSPIPTTTPFCGNKTPLLADPNDDNRLYVGCRQLWRTTEARVNSPTTIDWQAINWTGVSPLPTNFIINAMDMPRGNANLLWLGMMLTGGAGDVSPRAGGQLWKTTNATAATPAFVQMDVGKGLPARPVFDIAIDPRDNQKVYVSYSGFAVDNLWRTTNGGTTWTNIGAGLPAVPIWTVAVHPLQTGWLYAGTDVGLYISTDDGATWSATTRGPATVSIADLQWKGTAGLLTVATYGRGVHEYDARPNPELLFSESAQVPFGALIRGRVENLLQSDNKRLVLSRPPLSQNLTAVLTTRGGFTTSATPVGSNVEFSIESLASQDVDQTLEWFDFLNDRFVTMQIVRLTAGQERTTTRAFAPGASRFISPTTRQLQARLTWTPVRTSSAFSVEIDAAQWRITR